MTELFAGTSTPVPIQHFECPVCKRSHRRGQFGEPGSGLYRCLHCGYVGRGYHPDLEIDTALSKEARDNELESIAAGTGFYVGVPPEPCPIGYVPTEDDLFRAQQRGVL